MALTTEQIRALDAVLVELASQEPDEKRRTYLQTGRRLLQNHDPEMMLVSMIAGGVPADHARSIIALVIG